MRKLPRASSRGGDGWALGCPASVDVSCAEHAVCWVVPQQAPDSPGAEWLVPRGPVAPRWDGDGDAAGPAPAAAACSVTKCSRRLLGWKA